MQLDRLGLLLSHVPLFCPLIGRVGFETLDAPAAKSPKVLKGTRPGLPAEMGRTFSKLG